MSRDFFQIGGTLSEDAPSYIERPADEQLAQALAKNEVCLVLAPRQTGKSSLIVHALSGLRERGTRSAMIDLQPLGRHQDFAHWLGDVVYQIEDTLGLASDTSQWWKTHENLGASQRFMKFIEDVVLAEAHDAQVILFFDEVDSVLPLTFSDDFFTTLRALYNARATKPSLKRLSFVLSGVVDAAEFISDTRRTPFNVGTRILLQDFDANATQPFCEVLGDNSADLIKRTFYWTNGQPFMVQSLAATISALPEAQRTVQSIDELVQRTWLNGKIEQDTHFKFIQEYLLRSTKLRPLLKLYSQVLQGKNIQADEQNSLHKHLLLAGIVKIENGCLQSRNRIYAQVFDLEWIKQNSPKNLEQLFAYSSIVLFLITLVIWIYMAMQPTGMIKVDEQGNELEPSAKKWACVKDWDTGLVWEVKAKANSRQGDNTLYDADDRYTWYQNEKGTFDEVNSQSCYGYKSQQIAFYCNTQAYVQRINANGYCGFTDWRVPSIPELNTLISNDEHQPAINIKYFPNTRSDKYWTSFSPNNTKAWYVDFLSGNVGSIHFHKPQHIRLVRGELVE